MHRYNLAPSARRESWPSAVFDLHEAVHVTMYPFVRP